MLTPNAYPVEWGVLCGLRGAGLGCCCGAEVLGGWVWVWGTLPWPEEADVGLWGTEDAGCRVTGPEDWRTGDWGTERTGLEVPEAVILLFIARWGIPDLPPKFRLHNTIINMYLGMKRPFLFCIFNRNHICTWRWWGWSLLFFQSFTGQKISMCITLLSELSEDGIFLCKTGISILVPYIFCLATCINFDNQ